MKLQGRLSVLRSLFRAVILGVGIFYHYAHAATISVVNNDGPGEGFNDPTPAAPVGGNPGTTVGAQRLNAFQFAANLWAANLQSTVTIIVGAEFNPLSCTANSAVLGAAGPNSIFRDFLGAPVANTWYVEALANSLAGADQDGESDDIGATFSSTIGTPGCLQNSGWYYGLDGNTPANRIDFVTVLLHEMGHGLGFLDLINLSSGSKFLGFNDAYMRFLEDHSTGKLYPNMTNAERVAASKNTGNLHWTGANGVAAGVSLTAGRHVPSGHIQMYAPNPQQPGSSVAHWDTALSLNQLMEPIYTEPTHTFALELALFKDLGWPTQVPPPCGDGNINGGEECDDGNILNGDGCSSSCQVEACYTCDGEPSSCSLDASCGLSLHHFLFYKVKKTAGSPNFVPRSVQLEDQFENKNYIVKKPVALGNPANKNNEDPTAPLDPNHLKAYQIRETPGVPPHAPHTNVQVDNQFGTIFVNTLKADRLLLPTAKSHVSQPPPLSNPQVDHFKCYTVEITPGKPLFPPGKQATVVDQFNQPKTYNVKKPTHLCNPVSKNGEPRLDPDAHLMCYQVKPAAGQPRHNRVTELFVNNQFGPERLDTIKEEELCLPSLKTD